MTAGTITLRPLIDPNRVWNDPDQRNNSLANQSFTFTRKTPICEVTAAASVVYITGSIDPTANTGNLDYAWVYPSAAISQGMRTKLQRSATPSTADAAPQADESQVFVRLVRSSDALYTCFVGMQRTCGSSPAVRRGRLQACARIRIIAATRSHSRATTCL